MQHKVTISGLILDPDSNTPILLLKSEENDQVIPIWIGFLEATAIATSLKNIRFDRPMTHDLFLNFVELTGLSVTRVEVCDIQDSTFYAKIHFSSSETSFSLDSRPSDAIAIAIRADAPIFVDEMVFLKSNKIDEPVHASDDSEEGQKWAEYLKNLSSEDFGKYKV
ncbi:MAG: bifunctional nuclease family protein [Deltaproteobacteria bacterium]|nr:bifunctional nuclease family protein [Deltaproteobacteria bacterium]